MVYMPAPTIQILRAKRFSLLLVAKPGDHQSLCADINELHREGMPEWLQRRGKGGLCYLNEWANTMSLNANPKKPK
jgi:hypothetical protein